MALGAPVALGVLVALGAPVAQGALVALETPCGIRVTCGQIGNMGTFGPQNL